MINKMKPLRKLIKDSHSVPTWPIVWLHETHQPQIIHQSALFYDTIIATQEYIAFLTCAETQIEADIR